MSDSFDASKNASDTSDSRIQSTQSSPARDSRLETRDSRLDTRDSFDLIVIGAGINGAGIARDAAMRGLRVLLLDKGDISSGTTAWSTRLIHGGLRYLEHFEFGLVRESLRERQVLLDIAPHLVKPLPLLIPIYRNSKRGPLTIRAGMIAYDSLSLGKSLRRHHMLTRQQALATESGLNPDGLLAATQYYDAQVEFAERLALENALDARSHGATVRTYNRVDRFIQNRQRVIGIEYTDLESGETASAFAAITVNVSGPWVDETLHRGGAASRRLIGGTKGSHIIVGNFPGAPRVALYAEARSDRRPFFIIPWNQLYLIGTTDTRYAGNLDLLTADESEIHYLIDEANHVIPDAGLDRTSVLYTYAGIRPLPYVENESESAITRRHIIHDHSADRARPLDGLISVIGGKLTTYRNLSRQVVDAVFRKLGRASPDCRTSGIPLPGSRGNSFTAFVKAFRTESGLAERTADHLVSVYGSRAAKVLELAREQALARQIDQHTGAIAAEIVFSFTHEFATTLADTLLRRTMIGFGPDLGIGALDAALQVCKTSLGWTEQRAARERDAYLEYIGRFKPRAATV